jgi:subtilase family serine protease
MVAGTKNAVFANRVKFPGSPGAQQSLLVVVDPNDTVHESNETDNELAVRWVVPR